MKTFGILLFLLSLGQAKELCNKAQKNQMTSDYSNCVQLLQHRLSDSLHETDKNGTGFCQMVQDSLFNCSLMNSYCFNSKEMRQLQESHLQKLTQNMSKVYNLSICDLSKAQPQRLARHGAFLPTKDCDVLQINKLSVAYSLCMTSANHDMTRDIIYQKSVEDIFAVVCKGMEKVVHNCSKTLDRCYSKDEINETKVGQLQLTKKIMDEILRVKRKITNPELLDLSRCPAFSSMASLMTSASPTFFPIPIILNLISVACFHYWQFQ